MTVFTFNHHSTTERASEALRSLFKQSSLYFFQIVFATGRQGHAGNKDAWWQWFEINPVEVGSDELEGWGLQPTFDKGVSSQNLAEYSLALLLGLATAAPAAPLSSILGMIWRNLPQNVAGSMLGRVMQTMSKDLGDKEMDRIDNVNPASDEPFFGAEKTLHRGNGFENAPRLHLVDSGMANNLPTHVFLHPRECDSYGRCPRAQQRIRRDQGLTFTPRIDYSPLPPLPEIATTDPKDKGKKIPIQLSPEDMAKRFEGRYAQILDGVATHVVVGREGVVYNEKHQPQAWREMLLVYLPLLPRKDMDGVVADVRPLDGAVQLVVQLRVDAGRGSRSPNVKSDLPDLVEIISKTLKSSLPDLVEFMTSRGCLACLAPGPDKYFHPPNILIYIKTYVVSLGEGSWSTILDLGRN
ncbi:hypothetical protein C8R44DRAFT_726440 [Mycena epipterygia]|nr:hypothetical protein C8R44DRAFT_726440 [Mycena epipterygia]